MIKENNIRMKMKLEKPRCPECASKQTQFRVTDQIRWCRVCGCHFTYDAQSKKSTVLNNGNLVSKKNNS